MHHMNIASQARTTLSLLALLAALAARAEAVSIQWTFVGNPGNAPDPLVALTDKTTGYGSVDHNYNISTNLVTYSQYAEMLNVKDRSGFNQFRLYNPAMSDATHGGIQFNAAAPAGSKYSVMAGRGDRPAAYVNWYDAIRFANWLNNGQGNGSTEVGAYTLGLLDQDAKPLNPQAVTRNPGAQVFLPSENEWYKAAYYDPGTQSYFRFATGTNTIPVWGPPSGDANIANYVPGGYPGSLYELSIGHTTDVGAFYNAVSPYGTYDQSGNVDQWNESTIQVGIYQFRGLRGGTYNYVWDHMLASYRGNAHPNGEYSNVGFRLASVAVNVPEPSSAVLALIAGALLWWRRRRLK